MARSAELRAAALALASVWALPRPASAHGGLFRAARILVDSRGPALVQSEYFGQASLDAQGAHWSCAEVYGLSSFSAVHVGMALTDGGARFVASPVRGLVVTRDGCSYQDVAATRGLTAHDVVRKSDATYVLVSDPLSPRSTLHVRVARADSEAFEPAGVPVQGELDGSGLAVTAAGTLYVTGTTGSALAVARSADGGRSWSLGSPVPVEGDLAFGVEVAALDPERDDTLYVKRDEREWGASSASRDELFVSHDGGKTLTSLYRDGGPLHGFAVSPTGDTLLLAADSGLHRAARSAATVAGQGAFALVSPQPHYGLSWTSAGLFAGLDEFAPQPFLAATLGSSDDAGDHFSPLLAICAIGAAVCPSESDVGRLCGPVFSDQGLRGGGFKEDFLEGTRCRGALDAGVEVGGALVPDAAVAAPSPGSTPPVPVGPLAPDAGSGQAAEQSREAGGAGCALAGEPAPGALLLVAFTGSLVATRRRRGTLRGCKGVHDA
jgi:hypothetical protein